MIPVVATQGTPEWFQARCGKATGSHFADVLATVKTGEAATRRNYRVRLALERITGQPAEDTFKSQAMLDGTAREPIARSLYEFRTGNLVEETGFWLHSQLDCGVSPDGLIDSNGMIEIKCPTPAVHLEYLLRKDAPPEYKAQYQGQLWVMQREWVDFVTFNPDFPENSRLRVIRTYRDEDYIARLAAEVERFMDEVRQTADEILHYQEAA